MRHMVSVITSQLCYQSMETAKGCLYAFVCKWFQLYSNKTLFIKQAVGQSALGKVKTLQMLSSRDSHVELQLSVYVSLSHQTMKVLRAQNTIDPVSFLD